ncbi:formyltransferase family protein [Lentzea atacamensis]|uniref:formyltransferase family protein n=1 Tax=Lentzea atacamensis TaxID=531938 RepID=UPI000DD4CAFD
MSHDDTERYRGANPYARVRRHGARTIAATAHIATEVLDDGHIIAQESRHVDALGPMRPRVRSSPLRTVPGCSTRGVAPNLLPLRVGCQNSALARELR